MKIMYKTFFNEECKSLLENGIVKTEDVDYSKEELMHEIDRAVKIERGTYTWTLDMPGDYKLVIRFGNHTTKSKEDIKSYIERVYVNENQNS